MYTEINNCRICKSKNLLEVLSLWEQHLTGVFPKTVDTPVTCGPVSLVKCMDCQLLQMRQSYDLEEMYGDNYGYRSWLNGSMVKHLTRKIHKLESLYKLIPTDIVVDIGSNDATSLKAYNSPCKKVWIDPTGSKFQEFYTDDISLVPDFFTAENFFRVFPGKKAKIITSIAMFYDLEDPNIFVSDIAKTLADEGVWHFEQSYMPSMLRMNSYDTVCHEHLEYYSFFVIKNLLEKHGLRVVDVEVNAINGWSFAVTACKTDAAHVSNTPVIQWMLNQEKNLGINDIRPFRDFEEKVYRHKNDLLDLIKSLVADGKKIIGYWASTKWNVLLQFCGIDSSLIPYIAEVNPEKFWSFTPGTLIPIISEKEAKAMNPDYYFVLPWHFKESILQREEEFIKNGWKFIFPLPEIEIIG
jgi:C-methyltransferase C-terminal domain/Putative zinc binding domain/Methyltransferase domain